MADIGYGIEVWVGANVAAATATIKLAKVRTTTPPEVTRDEVDFSNQDSPNRTKQFGPGWTDPGELQIEGLYDVSNLTEDTFIEMMVETSGRLVELRFTQEPGDPVFRGRAWLKAFAKGTPIDAEMTFTASLRAESVFGLVGA